MTTHPTALALAAYDRRFAEGNRPGQKGSLHAEAMSAAVNAVLRARLSPSTVDDSAEAPAGSNEVRCWCCEGSGKAFNAIDCCDDVCLYCGGSGWQQGGLANKKQR